jgi:hypothetical protein
MAQCQFCQKHVADNLARCPHCFTRLESAGAAGSASSRGRPGKQRIRRRPPLLIKPARLLQLPASRLALLGCLGLVGVLFLGAVILATVAPQSARALLWGPPTPVPPTPRPTPTPSPTPTPTPPWTGFQGYHASYSIAFPPDWIVLDFADAGWKRTFRRLSIDFPWLKEKLPDDRLQEEADAGAIWSFDPGRSGDFSIRCRLERSLAGLSPHEIRQSVGEQLLQIPATLGGRIQGGTRTEFIEMDGQQAVAFELVVLPGHASDFDQPLKLQFYVLADKKQGYWIEATRIEQEPVQEDRIVQAVLASFHRLQASQ